MEELKPCPFCGGEVAERCFDGYDAIQCDNCGQVVIMPQHGCGKEHIAAFNRRAAPENSDYMDGVKYAIYEIFKEADISGSQEIRDSGDTDDGMCARAAEKIRAELYAAPENKPLTLEQLRQMDGEPVWIKADHYGIYADIVNLIGKEDGENWVSFKINYRLRENGYGKTWLAYANRPEGT